MMRKIFAALTFLLLAVGCSKKTTSSTSYTHMCVDTVATQPDGKEWQHADLAALLNKSGYYELDFVRVGYNGAMGSSDIGGTTVGASNSRVEGAYSCIDSSTNQVPLDVSTIDPHLAIPSRIDASDGYFHDGLQTIFIDSSSSASSFADNHASSTLSESLSNAREADITVRLFTHKDAPGLALVLERLDSSKTVFRMIAVYGFVGR